MLEEGKRVGDGRRDGSKGGRGRILVSETSPPPRGGDRRRGGNAGGMGDNIGKMLVGNITLPPVIVINRDVRGPVIVEIKICPADRNASTGVEKKSGIRKRGPSRQSRHRNRNDESRRLGREVSEIGRHGISGKINPRGTNSRGRMLRGGDAFDDLSDNIIKRADIVLGGRNLDMVGPRNWAFRDLAHMDGRSNMDARVGLKSNQLPPEKPSFVPAKGCRAGRKSPPRWDAMESRTLTSGAIFDMGGPEGGPNGLLDLEGKSAKRPSFISERAPWGDASLP